MNCTVLYCTVILIWCVHSLDMKFCLLCLCLLSCSWRSRVSPCGAPRGHLDRGCVSICSGSSSTSLSWFCWPDPSPSLVLPQKHHWKRQGCDPHCLVFWSWIWWLVFHTTDCVSQSAEHWLLSLLLQYLPPITISLINLFFPHIFPKISSFEDYSFTMQVNATLMR